LIDRLVDLGHTHCPDLLMVNILNFIRQSQQRYGRHWLPVLQYCVISCIVTLRTDRQTDTRPMLSAFRYGRGQRNKSQMSDERSAEENP